jgi:hypothetical protein
MENGKLRKEDLSDGQKLYRILGKAYKTLIENRKLTDINIFRFPFSI